MILSPLMRMQLRPNLFCWFKQSRNIRPNIKIGKEKFQLQLDVRNFDKDEIRVKARPEYVIIEGKQQKQTKRGLIMRQFIRKFKLPFGCVMETMESKLSPDGMLTITATRKICSTNLPCEIFIPINPGFCQKDENTLFMPVEENKPVETTQNPCAKFGQDKKNPPDNKNK